jgi:hypothetical protein
VALWFLLFAFSPTFAFSRFQSDRPMREATAVRRARAVVWVRALPR